MTDSLTSKIEDALRQYVDPYLGKDFISSRVVKQLSAEQGNVQLDLVLGYPIEGYRQELVSFLQQYLTQVDGVESVEVQIETKVIAHAVQKTLSHLPAVKNIIAVGSGKGGVGKSTVAVNLALALQAEGGRVGLLDADIYGPSQTKMLGMTGKPESPDGKNFIPMSAHGLQAISMGLLVDEETPMIWRGPMVTQALQQMLFNTQWDDLDYLIVDLPPGTGDIQLTLAQKIPVSGAVIITTPQDIALLDARKALKMFEKVDVPVLGIIENMASHVCSQCGYEEAIFGSGGAAQMSEDYHVDVLGALPLDIRIREHTDEGKPSVIAEPEGDLAEQYSKIARSVAGRLSLRGKDYAASFPGVRIEKGQ